MNRWLFLATSTVIALNAHANQTLGCDYKDYFRLSDRAHPGIYVVSGYSEQDVILELVGPRSFIIRDSYSCRAGYAHVTIAYDQYNWCILDIKDGPMMNHPTVNASCSGMRYLNTSYDGIGSYSYTIDLD